MTSSDSIRLTNADLRAAASAKVVDRNDVKRLWKFLRERHDENGPRFDIAHVLSYGGALVVIAAMGLLAIEMWNSFGDMALAITAAVYAVGFAMAGDHLWRKRGQVMPGGLLMTLAVGMVPVAVFGVQKVIGLPVQGTLTNDPMAYQDFGAWISGSTVPMALAAITAGVVALHFFRFPFLIMPIVAALWVVSVELAPWVVGADWQDWYNRWNERMLVSATFGLIVIACAWLVDVRSDKDRDVAFWMHLAGLLAFWGGLSAMQSDSELVKSTYGLTNIVLLALSMFLARQVYAIAGAIGIAMYLNHLATEVFSQSLYFPFALAAIGIGAIALGMLFLQRRQDIERWMKKRLPQPLRALRPAHAA